MQIKKKKNMRRGEVWLCRAEGYASKPRPVVIIQSDAITDFQSSIMCLITSFDSGNIPTRVRLDPSEENGLQKVSWVATDKIMTVPLTSLSQCIGSLSLSEMAKVNQSLCSVLNLF
ncbi:type II toxin-antitoxin system PemK/MazF family toxin [uncultured Sutterella sp.]|uniref:type II toxin-antitoxin system PemK/MazF family toxin n=1 Tax=uncultured Sutterella sp. TaxID=286133 RepID=UPI00261F6C9D|nr:type II toxin-antitoxin system PemK/MazF family toxin [uncultured Sutterella sp.]